MISIRTTSEKDIPQILRVIKQLAEYEKLLDQVETLSKLTQANPT